METLQHGERGQQVLDLQCALAASGVYAGNLDGCYGPATQESLQAFQRERGLPATGLFDEGTAAALKARRTPQLSSHLPAITADLVAHVFPEAKLADITCNLPHVLNALVEAEMVTPESIAMALATIRTETSVFLPISEKQSPLNTSPGGKPFDLYDTRAALGNTGEPDGASFRGRGFIQLTGRANYLRFGQAIGLGTQLVSNPLLAHDPTVSGKLLANFLKSREVHLRSALGKGDLIAARRAVNGGSTGLQAFGNAYTVCLKLLPKTLEVVQRLA